MTARGVPVGGGGGEGLEVGSSTVSPGGTIDVTVTDGSSTVQVFVGDDDDGTDVDVVDGKASIEVPPDTPGGATVLIYTTNPPPSWAEVDVVSSS